MKTRTGWLSFVMLAAALAVFAGQNAEDFVLPGVDGQQYTLGQYEGKIVVLEWTNYDCPFVRKFYGTGTMQKLQKKYTDQGVIWLSICSSAPGKQGNFPTDVWKRRIKEAGASPTAVLLDGDGVVGHRYGASNTPHIFIVGRDGQIAYQGSVDDQRTADPDSLRDARIYLAEALDALIAGKQVSVPENKAYGCTVKY